MTSQNLPPCDFKPIECACVDEEPAIAEDKGDFIWRGVP